MASESNVVIGSFTETSEIVLGSNNFSQVWMGTNLLWEKSVTPTESWVTYTTDYIMLVEYTPSSNMTVESFSMILDENSSVYNYIVGIYTATSSNVFSQTGTSGVSIVAGDTLDGDVKYTHTKSFGGTGPSLTAGTKYYFGLGERYAAYKALSSTADDAGQGAELFGWSMTNDPATPNPPNELTDTTLYLKVTAL